MEDCFDPRIYSIRCGRIVAAIAALLSLGINVTTSTDRAVAKVK
jgi:hypothetical protein